MTTLNKDKRPVRRPKKSWLDQLKVNMNLSMCEQGISWIGINVRIKQRSRTLLCGTKHNKEKLDIRTPKIKPIAL